PAPHRSRHRRRPGPLPRRLRQPLPALDVELEQDHVTVGDDVLLALLTSEALVAGRSPAADADEVLPADGLGADEAAFAVGVDDPGGLRGGVAGVDGPGARL